MTNKGVPTRVWRHKVHTDFKFSQGMNHGHKTWNTGVWVKKLKMIVANKANSFSEESISRANYVLSKRENDGKTAPPVKGMSFYPFEEYLPNHIRETYVIICTGSPMSFFDNPYVRDLLSGLNPRHRPVYRSKLTKLLRCVTDVSQKEVSIILMTLIP